MKLNPLSSPGKHGRALHALQHCPCRSCSKKRNIHVETGKPLAKISTVECSAVKAEEKIRKIQQHMTLTTSLWLIRWGNNPYISSPSQSYFHVRTIIFIQLIFSTSFVRQSGGVQKPISLSARSLLFFWWIFVLVLTSVYTANLTAHLTFKYSSSSITS